MFQTSVSKFRPMAWLLPAFSTVAWALIVCMPWGLPAEAGWVPPFLVLAAVFAWTVRRADCMPTPAVFAIGIAVDVLVSSPVGFWSFLFLVAHALAMPVAVLASGWRAVAALICFIPVAGLCALLAWLIASAYFARLLDAGLPMTGAIVASVCFPLVLAVTYQIERLMLVRTPAPSSLGGAGLGGKAG